MSDQPTNQTAVSQDSLGGFLSRLNRGFCGWFWPTSVEKAIESETRLLELGGLGSVLNNPQVIFRERVPIESKFSFRGPEFINTVIYKHPENEAGNEKAEQSLRRDVVLVHGFGAGFGLWYRNIKGIADLVPHSRVFAIDLLGMGRSSRPPFPKYIEGNELVVNQAIDFFVDSLESWREQQDRLEKFTLVGHSMGGYLAALYALKHPERVSKLVLASPVGIPIRPLDPETHAVAVTGHTIPGWLISLWNNHYTPQGVVRGFGPIGPRLVSNYIYRRFPYLSEEEKECLSSYAYHITSQEGSGEYALGSILAPGAWAREPLHRRLKDLKMPTAFMFGEHDWIDYRHAQEASGEMTVRNAVIRVPNSGHHLYLDNYPEFNRIVASIVNGGNEYNL